MVTIAAMQRLTTKQLERLRGVAKSALKKPLEDRPDLGIAPEDLLVACDRVLGLDSPDEEMDDDEWQAIVATSHQECAKAWRRCMCGACRVCGKEYALTAYPERRVRTHKTWSVVQRRKVTCEGSLVPPSPACTCSYGGHGGPSVIETIVRAPRPDCPVHGSRARIVSR